jgi:hypothetical protein
MVIIHYSLFAMKSVADFPKAVNSYMAISTGTLMDDVKEACQGLASVMKGDSDKIFDILMKNVLGMLLSLSSCIRDFTYWYHYSLQVSYLLVVVP